MEFYDLEKDPFEMSNEYEDPAYAKIIQQMKQKLLEARHELGETDANFPSV